MQLVVKVKFTSSPARLTAVAEGAGILPSSRRMPFKGVAVLRRVVIDEETGQFGTEAAYRNSKLVFRCDHMDGKWLEQGQPGYEPFNREIIEMMKRLEPAVTDSEALCLHSEMYHVGWPPSVRAKWDKEKQEWIEDDIFLYYLKQGWLAAMREGRIEEWRAHLKARIRGEWEERKRRKKRDTGDENDQDETGFLMPDDPPEENALLGEPVPASKRFDGRWRFYKHLYDTTGLDTLTETRDIKSAEARVLVTYQYNDTLYHVYSPYATTDDTGGFFIQIDGMPPGASEHKAYAVIFPSGPDPSAPKISVCDPNITIQDFWKNPDDPDLFPCRKTGLPNPYVFTPGLIDTLHFGTLYPGSYPTWPQPEGGQLISSSASSMLTTTWYHCTQQQLRFLRSGQYGSLITCLQQEPPPTGGIRSPIRCPTRFIS